MNNLPILFDDKVNSPELLALMQQFGENTYLTAEEINKMRDGINELFANIGGNQLIQNTGLIRNGQVFTFQPLWVWKILGEYYSNEQIIVHTVQYSQAGYWRMVLFYANAQNEILMNNGQEVPLSQSPYEPTLPANCVRLTALPVYESSYGNWQEPIIGDNFKDKSESSIIDIYNVGSLPNLSVNSNAAHFRIHNASDLKSLYLSEISNNYPGKLFYITNKKNTAFNIPHNASGINIHQPFIFPNNSGYSVQPNETLTFYWSENKLNYLSSSMVSSGGYRVVVLDNNSDGSVFTQGVTGNVLLKTYPIGKLKKNAVYRINLKMIKTGTGANFAVFVELGNKSNFPVNLVNSGAASNLYMGITRDMKTFTDNLGVLKASSFTNSGGYYTDIMVNASKPGIVDLNIDSNYSFKLIVTTTSLTDIIQLDSLMITEFTV